MNGLNYLSRMQSISILGCGWLGLPLGKHLAKAGYEIKGSTTHADKIPLLEKAEIKPFLLAFAPHLIGDAGEFFESEILLINLPPRNKDRIEDFHENQLKVISELATGKVKKVLFISSTAVYPSNNSEVFESDASLNCLSRGGVPLLQMEHLFSQDSGFETTVIRFGGLYGPDRHPGRFLAGKKDMAGANNPVNMIHQEDCIGVIQTILEQNQWGEVFNACSPLEETRQLFYEKAAKELGVEAPTFSNESARFKKVNADKLVEKTGYQFKY